MPSGRPLDLNIPRLDHDFKRLIQDKIDQKTKPPGSLGQLESLALKIGLIQNTATPKLNKSCIMVFAADHGLAETGVSAYPPSVTAQMVHNFLAGGAAINVFARQHGLDLLIVDAGVNADFPALPGLIKAKIAKGTANCLNAPAMTAEQCLQALLKGAELVLAQHASGCNCIGLGEMGIGNTSSAALLMHALTGLPLTACVGRGTGLDDRQLRHKLATLEQATGLHATGGDALKALQAFGGFEIAMMAGAFLQAAALRMVILADGFIACSALLVASRWYPAVVDYCVFSHVSDELGHQTMLEILQAQPLLNLSLRLGEGSGAALAFPLLQSAVAFLNEMATFEQAGVDQT
ncbi:MAG: nicotinate-nucleotide--dimethylbenzimidazole phosphoribosyltransferase [Methylomonas sp.]|nr:MAG: nicotinate-nucleotide--dimethylbenzimidazole phosphoribosyltransferase [Methylobacter sp.]PPD34577.1 MAG: nicotinate-nucleotide--dimethylbenzimidazole phosphoribosyltransferase [Methylomonas sp.]